MWLKKFHGADHGSDSDTATDTFGQDMDMPAEHPPTNVDNDEPPQSDKSEEEEGTIKLEHTWELPCEGAPVEGIEENDDIDN